MTSFFLYLVSGLGLAGLYFLMASGLSLIFGLMNVLNLAHGAFFAIGGLAAWFAMDRLEMLPLWPRFVVAIAAAAAAGLLVGALTERFLIRRLFGLHIEQILLTIGLGTALVALLGGWFGYDPRLLRQPSWLSDTTTMLGARIPNNRLFIIAVALLALVVIQLFLARSRHGLIIRAGVENPEMVRALGIDVDRSFTIVFAVGGGFAGLGGALGAVYFNGASPALGASQLIFAFIVVVVGGLGSIGGTAIAAVLVATVQVLLNNYLGGGLGSVAVVALLGIVLLLRPQGLLGSAPQ